MTTLVDDLEKDHRRLRRYLASYLGEIDKMARGEQADMRLLEFLATYFAQFPDELHHKKEDIIYSRLEAKSGARRAGLENLHEQHEHISTRARHFAEIVKAVLNDEELPVDRIVEEAKTYADILAKHMAGEEGSLFEPARELFTREDWEAVNDEIADLYAMDINFEKAKEAIRIDAFLDR